MLMSRGNAKKISSLFCLEVRTAKFVAAMVSVNAEGVNAKESTLDFIYNLNFKKKKMKSTITT